MHVKVHKYRFKLLLSSEDDVTDRYYFNREFARCEMFSGCRERGANNFNSLRDCQEVCEGNFQ